MLKQVLKYKLLNVIFFISLGANCPLVFGVAIPAFGYISPLRCEDTASIGADKIIVLIISAAGASVSLVPKKVASILSTNLKIALQNGSIR